jgi:hypothetical protein
VKISIDMNLRRPKTLSKPMLLFGRATYQMMQERGGSLRGREEGLIGWNPG